jgi:pyruvate, water dikinase
MPASSTTSSIAWFSDLGLADLDQVGGKNSSLGEMIRGLASAGVRVPNGFATTANAYRSFLAGGELAKMINAELATLDTENVEQLATVGRRMRDAIVQQPLPASLEADIRTAYARLAGEADDEASFAVRSSATAEDLPDASFAGQQETFLNVTGIDAILDAIKEVYASLYNDRAIAYSSTRPSRSLSVCNEWCVQILPRPE